MNLPTDAELLAHQKLPAAAMWTVLAARALIGEGRALTVEAVMARTGYGKSQVYAARKALDAAFPGWRDSGTPDTLVPVDRNGSDPPEQAGLEPVRPPVWQIAVRRHLIARSGARSWDLYADVYGPAYDDVLAAGAGVGDAIALTVHYVEGIDGDELDSHDRALVAKLVRQYGKASLYGLSRAIGTTHEETGRDRYRYARAVAARIVAEIRASQREETTDA